MARSPAPSPQSRRSQWLWPTALVVALAAFSGSVVPIAHFDAGAAVAYGVVSLLVLIALASLRTQHLRAESDVARYRDEIRGREADAARRDAGWRSYLEQRASQQTEVVREEVEHLVKERLPAALTRTEIPAPLHSGEWLGEAVSEWFDRLLTEVSEAVDNREESQRLALVELASRVQTSAHRIQAAVTGLADRHPGDADLLETTMRVDHAATQQARHAQSLKVLCGEWPGQQWQKPLAMVDVVRAASGRIVAFNRIEVTGDPDVGVTPSIVEPLIHLLAELLANATEYSPPRTGVPVTVRTVQRGAVVEVDDGGLGMDEYRLSEAREIVSGRRLLGVGEVGEIPQTGFAVVGRFADRHGFDVDLGPSPYGGIRAVVLVPAHALETLAPAGTAPPARSAPPTLRLPHPASPPDTVRTPYGPALTGRLAVTGAVPPVAGSVIVGTAGPEAPSDPGQAVPRLPQRRSRRDEYAPAVEAAPTAVTPPGTPEEAGDWMEQFLEGGLSAPPSGSVLYEGQDGPSSLTADSPEGQS
ncbi:ATP-binding protein [Streptomyces sp. NPDC088400]|uniref:ATP-binding protein n=1 Tax=Streptomyces sp. NPDC088400 TaxID=3365861 RepID=UPI00381EEC4C